MKFRSAENLSAAGSLSAGPRILAASARPRRPGLVVAAASVVAFALALAAGLAIGAELWPAALALVAVLALCLAYQLDHRPVVRGYSSDLYFWLALGLVFLLSLVSRLPGGPNASFLIEGMVLFCVPLALPKTLSWLRSDGWAQTAAVLLAAYFAIALVSSLTGRSGGLALVYQVWTNAKFVLVVMLGLYLAWSDRSDRAFRRLVQWGWVPAVALVAFQWLAPGANNALFPQTNYLFHGILPVYKAVAFFKHPSFLAFYSGCFLLLAVVWSLRGRSRRFLLPAAAYAALLFASGQRQEMAAALLALTAVVVLAGGRDGLLRRAVAGALGLAVALGAVWALMRDYVMQQAVHYGLIEGAMVEDVPRALLYRDAVAIAEANFPLGSGLGTFGSAGAARFDLSYYYDLAYERYGWWTRESALQDTFWSQHIAEAGWFGFAAILSFYLVVLLFCAVRALRADSSDLRTRWLCAFAATAYIVAISPTSPAMEDTGLALVVGMLIGVAVGRSRRGAGAASTKAGRLGPVSAAAAHHLR